MINELFESYNDKKTSHTSVIKEIRDQIDTKNKKIDKLNRNIEKLTGKINALNNKHVFWVDEIIYPLAQQLAAIENMCFEVCGPFGIGSRTTIYLKKFEDVSIVGQETYSITLTPHLAENQLFYETGGKINRFAEDTIGAINGGNNEVKMLPDDPYEIIKLMKEMNYNLKND